MQITPELMATVTCLIGHCLGAAVFQPRADEHDGVLHHTEQSAHVFTAGHGTGGQDGLGPLEKFLDTVRGTV